MVCKILMLKLETYDFEILMSKLEPCGFEILMLKLRSCKFGIVMLKLGSQELIFGKRVLNLPQRCNLKQK